MKGFRRPPVEVLPDEALVPPERFTHEVVQAQPWWTEGAPPNAHPGGDLPAGTRVLLVRRHGDRALVVDATGRRVETGVAGLRALDAG